MDTPNGDARCARIECRKPLPKRKKGTPGRKRVYCSTYCRMLVCIIKAQNR